MTVIAGMTGSAWNRTGLRRNANQSPQDATQLAAEKEFCAWRLRAGASAGGDRSRSLQDFLCALGAQVTEVSEVSRETRSLAISASCVVERDGFEPEISLAVLL
jgi:hypothetical protein